MIIYLPLPDFEASAKALDLRRLGNQRRDVHRLLQALLEDRTDFIEPPLIAMWQGYEGALANYGVALSREIDERGYQDPFYYASFRLIHRYGISFIRAEAPPWLGKGSLHASHRAALKREVTQALAKAHFALKNRAKLRLGLAIWELEDRLHQAEREYEWYERFGWEEGVEIPLVWPKK